MTDGPCPLIITARLDDATQAQMQALRDRHFPPARNIVPAHISLFHHLPGDEHAAVTRDLSACTREMAAFPCVIGPVRFLGNGNALTVDAPALLTVRQALADRWAQWLTPQDRQPFRPHVTVHNKVPAAQARATQALLDAELAPLQGIIIGLDCWHYRGGPWAHDAAFLFAPPSGISILHA